MVKTTTKVVNKDTTNKLTKYWPGVSYFILKNKFLVPKNSPQIDIGYKNNFWTVLSFFVIEGSGSKNIVLTTYLSNLIVSIMLSYDLLFIPRSCLSCLDLSKQFTPTTIPDSHIQPQNVWGNSVWLTAVMYYSPYYNDLTFFWNCLLWV